MPKKSVRSKPPAKGAVRRGGKGAGRHAAKRAPSKPAKRVATKPAKRVATKPAKRVAIKPAKRVAIRQTADEPRPATPSAAAARRRTAKILVAALAQHAEETLKRYGALIRSGGDSTPKRNDSAPRGAGETLQTTRSKRAAAPKRARRKR